MIHPAGLPEALTRLDRTLLMGILNVTPDSFSDGGKYVDHDAAVAHGLAMVRDGADLVDVGGESTRPGATPVPSGEEQRRVVAVVRDLASEGIHVSIDTRHADVARAAVEAGAVIVNDVSGGRGDSAMWPFVAEAGVPYVLMHNRGDGIARPDLADTSEPSDIWAELAQRFDEATPAGIAAVRIALDPGIGFAKDALLSWRLVSEDFRRQARAAGLADRPVLLGASRKRFLATVPDGTPRDGDSMEQRDRLTLEITEVAVRRGAWCVRVHDVAPNAAAVRTTRRDDWIDP